MKKRLTGLISLILSLFLCLSFSACNLITYDNDREMKQIVATVSIDEKIKDEITLGDLVLSYINGGYLNEQYYGYTTEQNFDILLNQLVSQRILIQNAMLEFEADENYVKNGDEELYTPLRYLTEKEVVEAKYQTYNALNTYIKSYAEPEEESKKDSWIGETRVVPTGATNDVKEKTLEEKKAYIEKGVDKTDVKALNKAIESLDENAMLGADYKESGVIEDIEYFRLVLSENYEQEVLNIYYEQLVAKARAEITYEILEGIYASMYAKQLNFTNAEFVEKLSSATVDNPLLYGGFGGYGYVYNLLLGASDAQKEQISKIKEDNPGISDSDYATDRKEILDKTTVKDLRSYWVYSGYDAEDKDGKLYFTGDYTFAKEAVNSLAYQGTFEKVKDAEDGKTATYAVKSTETFNLNEFIAMMDGYLGTATEVSSFDTMGDDVYVAKELSNVSEYDAKINELLFAFSTDAGSLNTYKGYVIKPEVEGTATEQYVKTFGDAGRKLLSENKNAYVIVASDYGYHVMFYSKLIGADSNYETLGAYLDTLSIDKEAGVSWKDYYNAMLSDYEAFEETNSYLYKLASTAITTNSNTYQQNKVNEIVNKYLYNEDGEHPDCVSINKKVYENYYK